jgi:hypothetical protein
MKFIAAALFTLSAFAQSEGIRTEPTDTTAPIVITAGPNDLPDPRTVFIKSITYGGSGCPSGTVATSISNDARTFTLIFDSFIASSGFGVPVTEARKNCQLNFNLQYPQGYSYAVASVDYRGYVAVPFGVTATQKANYYFAGQTNQVSGQTVFRGPVSQDYLTRDEFPLATTVWSPCGAQANGNVNAQIRLEGTPQALAQGAQITVDSVDGKVRQIYSFQWRRC